MNGIIVDASVAVKWFIFEEEAEKARRIVESAARICAPKIMLGEVANALWKQTRRGGITPDIGAQALHVLPGYIHDLFDTDALLSAAFDMACALDHPIYDCLYVESAHRFDMPLLTADARLIRKLAGTRYATYVTPLSQWRP